LTVPARKTGLRLYFPLLAEVDFRPYRLKQELFPRSLGVPVKVMADALGQPVYGWRGDESSGRKTIISIGSGHELSPVVSRFVPLKSSGRISSDRYGPSNASIMPRRRKCHFRGWNSGEDNRSRMGVVDFLSAWQSADHRVRKAKRLRSSICGATAWRPENLEDRQSSLYAM
jgi:hypothetical protein